MTFGFIRTLFVLLSAVVGFQLGSIYQGYGSAWALAGCLIGAVIALFVIIIENVLGKVSTRGLSAAVFGLTMGLVISKILSGAIDVIPDLDPSLSSAIKITMILILCYIGMVLAMRGRDEFSLIIPYIKFDRQDQKSNLMILDTSAIIDGRIFDISMTKFLEGRFIIPRFVLKELQQVADSNDSLKRNRGRRGLDILNKLKKSSSVAVKIHDEDFPEISQVDEKLVKLARLLEAKIITNDFNLNKVAELQGVGILNINDLSNALKPIVLAGEMMEVHVVKEGKEASQGIGYLDDGTMVVVENSKKMIGQTIRVTVTSVLQTSAGRMIFSKFE